jgi:hypothetical protein
MCNLEKLDLDLTVIVNESFLDGNSLKKNLLYRLSKLNQLTFSIHSIMFLNNPIELSSQKQIAETFEDFPNAQIVTRLDSFPERKRSQCHVYSSPFFMQHYHNLTNNFPGGFYRYVRFLSLYDTQAFEHEFFLRISQAFPLMQKLTLINLQGQSREESSQSINDEQGLTLVKYFHLIELELDQVHDDYVEEFLSHRKTFFSNSIYLCIRYQSIARVTHHFRRDSTQMNCRKIKKIFLLGGDDYSIESLENYFPCAEID